MTPSETPTAYRNKRSTVREGGSKKILREKGKTADRMMLIFVTVHRLSSGLNTLNTQKYAKKICLDLHIIIKCRRITQFMLV